MFKFALASLFGFGVNASFSSHRTTTTTTTTAFAKGQSYIPPYASVENNSVVFLDIEATSQSWFGGASQQPLGRIEVELFDDNTPITARNFRSLCKGDMGLSPDGKKLHYKNCVFHRIINNFMCQSGDFQQGNGRGSCSIYGTRFKDETFKGKAGRHLGRGLVAMANAGPHTQGSQFYFATALNPLPHLDGKHVIFGQVRDDASMEVVHAIEAYGSETGTPKATVRIVDCGVIRETPVTAVRLGYGA
jgi:peptidylprolyl isomerase